MASFEILTIQLLVVLSAVGSAAYYRRDTDRLRATLQRGGFSSAELRPNFDLPVLTGDWSGRPVEVHVRQLMWRRRLDFKVRHLLPGVSAVPLGGVASWGDRVLTGDPELDARLAITGEPLAVLSALTPTVRAALLELTAQGWRLEEGDAVIPHRWSDADALPLEAMQELIAGFGRAVGARAPELGARIAGETSPEIQYKLLSQLSKFGAPYVRRELASGVPEGIDDRGLALAAALVCDGAAWDRASAEAQAEALQVAPEQVLALHRARSDEDALIAALDQVDEAMLPSVVEALGAVGTRLAVAALSPLAERTVLNTRLAQLATQATAQIQARFAGAERGQITVVDAAPQAGSLALAEGAGRLSVGQG